MASTKGNFSQPPADALAAAVAKNYVAVHVEQGVPVLDRDLNLLGDLVTATVRSIVQRHIGNGIAGTSDFAIQPSGVANDFAITAGTCVVNGTAITLSANTTYLTQTVPATASPAPPLPPLTLPSANRLDTVYIDAWFDEIDDVGDVTLANPTDVGIRTSTRLTVAFCIRVFEGATTAVPLPVPPAGHVYYPLAQLARPSGVAMLTTSQIVDQRQKSLAMPLLEGRLRALEGLLAPQITSFQTETVVAGQSLPIQVIGKNFLVGTVHVLVGGVEGVIDPATWTNNTMFVHVPINANVGTWPFTVRNDVGIAVATDPLTILAPAPSPKFATATATPGAQFTPVRGAAGVTITLLGTNFSGVNRVTFNTVPAISALLGGDLLSTSSTNVKVNVPAALPVGATCSITVSIDGVASASSQSTDFFTVDPVTPPPPPPQFAAASPPGPPPGPITPLTQIRNSNVTLTGQNFGTSTTTTQVKFEGTNVVNSAAADFINISPTQIVVKVPSALTIAASPNNQAAITVTVNGLSIKCTTLLNVL